MQRTFRKLWQYLVDTLCTNFFPILLAFFLGGYTSFYFAVEIPKIQPMPQYIFTSSIRYALGIFYFFLLPISKKGKQKLSKFFICILTLLFIAEHYLIEACLTGFTDSIVLSSLSTNWSETWEFIKEMNISALMMAILHLMVLGFIAWSIGQSVKKAFSRKKQNILTLLFFIATGISLTFGNRCFSNEELHYPHYSRMNPVERLYYSFRICNKDLQEAKQYLGNLEKVDLGTIQIRKQAPFSVILIIGESSSKHYMHCYGYPLPTTPKADSLLKTGNAVLYSDVISPAGYTAESLSKVLTLYTTESSKSAQWYNFPTLFQILNKVGIRTHWLSNQEKEGLFVNYVSAIAKTARSEEYVSVRSSRDWFSSKKFLDEALLPLLQHREEKDTSPAFFEVVHLMGTHGDFKDRYPNDYAPFKIEDIQRPISPHTDSERRDYICAIHYVDSVVDQIIKAYANEPAIVIYLSDHGYVVCDDPQNPKAIQHSSEGTGVEIPFMIYFSPQMQKQMPEEWKQIQANKDKKVMSDILSHTLLQLMGVSSKFDNPNYNFFSPSYLGNRPRLSPHWEGEH